nr:hypothetical protein [Tanacetum cinerariifolium]GEY36416.1 hypothetical protein [Tanacetum cinerariifolium]
MVDDNVRNQFRKNKVQYVGHLVGQNVVQFVGPSVGQNAVQNHGIQNVGNQNGLSVVLGIANQHGVEIFNYTVKPKKHDAAYLQKQMQIAQKEEAEIQLTSEEFDLMDVIGACEETKRDNANCTLENNLQQASTSEEQYTELLKPIPEPHQVPQNDSNVISEVSSMKQGMRTVEQHSKNVEETRAYHESLFHNLVAEVEKVNSVNRKMKETNAELTTELARYKNQEKYFEISQEKYDKLERCY